VGGRTDIALPGYVDEILASGFPGIRDLPERARQLQLDSYLARIVDRELPENGIEVRRPDALRQWLQAYGAATSTDTTYSKILDAATAGESDKPSRATVTTYREHLARIFILDPLAAWLPAFNPLKRLTRSPRSETRWRTRSSSTRASLPTGGRTVSPSCRSRCWGRRTRILRGWAARGGRMDCHLGSVAWRKVGHRCCRWPPGDHVRV
jgi:hypothetical protein